MYESASIAPLASTSASEDADDLAPPAPVQLDLALPSVETSDASSFGIAASADALLPASALALASEEEKQDDDDDDEEESPKMASVEKSGQFPQSKTPRFPWPSLWALPGSSWALSGPPGLFPGPPVQ